MPERKTLNEDLFYRGSSANLPRLHTCENKVPFWDFSQFAVTIPSMPTSWTTKITQKQSPKDYIKIRERSEKYFQGNKILPIPELVQEVQPKIISFVVTDLKTKRLAGIKKDTFEGLLKAADIPAKYYCRHSFATWDVLLPSEDLAAKMAGENVTSKYFRLQPEYMGRRKIRITVCNVPIQLNEEVLAAYLVKYREIEEITKPKSINGTAHGDYIFTMCLDRGGFTAVPHIIEYENQVMTVVVEGRKPQCWNCKQLGHFSKSCPQKTTKSTTPATTTANTTTTTTIAAAAAATTKTIAATNETTETGENPDKEEGWTQVVRGGKKKKTPIKKSETTIASTITKPTTTTTANIDTIATTTTTTTTAKSSSSSTKSSSSSSTKKKNKEKNNEKESEAMDCSINLKRRRDSGESVAGEGEKKHIKGPLQETKTQSQTRSLPQHKGEKKTERPAQIIPPTKTTKYHSAQL